jgi:sec-independent protein translocase protein TatC
MDQENGGGLPPDQTGTYPDDPHGPPPAEVLPPPSTALVPPAAAGGGGRIPPPPPPDDDEEDGEEGGMLRMSFMEHLEELRSRILRMLAGLGVAFLLCIIFSDRLWLIVQAPGTEALRQTGNPLAHFIAIDPMEQFSIIWMWTPLVASLFVAAPWILWQVWGFISPGLYKREKRWAAPFVISTAGLFILGGMFAYFIAFRYALAFLFNIGGFAGVVPSISIDRYFDLFVNVMLGIGLVFELPILVFFLTLLHIVSPRFLLKHSRYAILAIVIIAAIVTPTPDVFNLMLFAVPMCMLFFLGIFAS